MYLHSLKNDIVNLFNSLNKKNDNHKLFSILDSHDKKINLSLHGVNLPSHISLWCVHERKNYGCKSFEIVLLDHDREKIIYYIFVTPHSRIICEGSNAKQVFSWRTLFPCYDSIISNLSNSIFEQYLFPRYVIAITAINADIEGITFWTKRILHALNYGLDIYAYDTESYELFDIKNADSVLNEWITWLWGNNNVSLNRVAVMSFRR